MFSDRKQEDKIQFKMSNHDFLATSSGRMASESQRNMANFHIHCSYR